MQKKQLRTALRQARNKLTPDQQLIASNKLARQVTAWPPLESVRRLALYRASDGEIDPDGIFNYAINAGIDCFLPVIVFDQQRSHPNRLVFAPYNRNSVLKQNRYGIDEPPTDQDEYMDADKLDMVLLPLVGFDLEGNRLGMGGGFYDATFAFKKRSEFNSPPRLVGLAHSCQQVDHIRSETWDISLNTVITDCNIHQAVN